jgi:RHS repeat-associated protein
MKKNFKQLLSWVVIVSYLFMTNAVAFGLDKITFYHTDQVGTPLAMTDQIGDKVWEAEYMPFGEEYTVSGSVDNNKRFVGKEKDVETGLSYFGARYMDVEIGRFLAPDPVKAVDSKKGGINFVILRNPQRLNPYAYGLNNPYKFIDPDGLFNSYTHEIITSGVMAKHTTNQNTINIINKGNIYVDRGENFTNNNEHGMKNFFQKRADATLSSYNFQKEKMRKAIESLVFEGDKEKALFQLGQGIHSVQDEVAHEFISLPVHGNPKYIYRDNYLSNNQYKNAELATEKYVNRFIKNMGYNPFK